MDQPVHIKGRVDARLRTGRPEPVQALCSARSGSESCDDLERLLQSTPALMVALAPSGQLVMINPKLQQLLGGDAAFWAHQPATALFTPESARTVQLEALPSLLADQVLTGLPLTLQRRDGSRLQALFNGFLVRDDSGGPRSVVLFGEDTSHHRAHEERLQAERRRLNDIVEAADVGTWEWNVATGEVRFNERWARMLGHTLRSLGELRVETTWAALTHPDDMQRCRAALELHFQGESPIYACEFRMRHRKGHWVWILARGKVVSRTAQGAVEWVLGTHIDLSSVKRQQAELEYTHHLLKLVSRIARVGGYEFDFSTGELSLSTEAGRLLMLPSRASHAIAVPLARMSHQDRRRLVRAALAGFRNGRTWQVDVAHVDADGHRRVMNVTGRHVERADGRRSTIGSIQDVTQRVAERQRLHAALNRLRVATEAGAIGIWSVEVDTGLLELDAQALNTLAMPAARSQLTVGEFLSMLRPSERWRLLLGVARAARRGRSYNSVLPLPLADGEIRILRVAAISDPGYDGAQPGIVGAVWDISASCQLEQALQQQKDLLQVTLDAISDAVVTTNASGEPQWMNSAAERLLAEVSADAATLPGPLRQAVARSADGAAASRSGSVAAVSSHAGQRELEYSSSPLSKVAGAEVGSVVVIRDVTDRQRMTQEMQWRATHDQLTGLINRSEFEAQLAEALAATDGVRHALLYLDLDQFKLVNDACGHVVGDTLLQQVSRLIVDTVRSGDAVARLGGDEFAVILRACDTEQAQRAAQGICDRLDNFRFVHQNRRFRVGASIGVVPIDPLLQDPSGVLKAADAACFAAKDGGRNRIHTWEADDALIRERHGDMQWVSRIEQALDEDRFELFGQRIESLRNPDDGLHVEVLLRMREPSGQLVPPGAFIPAAERFNLSTRIDRWVLKAAIAWMSGLDDLGAVQMVAVNLSGNSVGDPMFVSAIVELLGRQSPAIRERLCVEITETSAITNIDNARLLVDGVRALGISVALDDFGAGASSFGYLRQLRVDYLKIDGQYVRDLLDDPLDSAAVKCFVEVARVTGIRTVAEFVEREDIREELVRLGVDHAQGYLVHRPEPLRGLVDRAPGGG